MPFWKSRKHNDAQHDIPRETEAPDPADTGTLELESTCEDEPGNAALDADSPSDDDMNCAKDIETHETQDVSTHIDAKDIDDQNTIEIALDDDENTSDITQVPDISRPFFTTRSGSASEQGLHARNDDCARTGWWCDCFVVSDGIGGAPDGDYMSRVACGAVLEAFTKYRNIEVAFAAGNAAAIQVSKWIDNPDCGATLLVGALDGDKMRFAWCGDSVAYRLHNGVLSLLTPADRSENSNVLISAIGYDPDLKPLLATSDVEEGDRFLLCTDGVWTVFEQSGRLGDLMNLMFHGDNAPLIASKICTEARRDGYDDASAVMVIIDGIAFEDDDLDQMTTSQPREKTPPPEEDKTLVETTPPPEASSSQERGSDVR